MAIKKLENQGIKKGRKERREGEKEGRSEREKGIKERTGISNFTNKTRKKARY